MRAKTSALSFVVANSPLRHARLLMAGFLFLAAFFAAEPVLAAAPTYKARELVRSPQTLEMDAGATAQFTITFKNVGTASWNAVGPNYVSIYTWEPKYRTSPFADASWPSSTHPKILADGPILPGHTGTFRFAFHAPSEAGTYHETFQLAAEGLAWIDGGAFTVDVVVSGRAKPVASAPASSAAPRGFAPGYKAQMLLVSDRSLTIDAGASKQLRVGFKNVGKTAWKKDGPLSLALRSGGESLFRDASWKNDVAAPLADDEVKPGQLAFFTLTLAAPAAQTGTFTPRFTLMAGDALVDGGEVEIPIDVRLGARPPQVDAATGDAMARSGPRGPDITIGLFTTRDTVRIAADGAYVLLDANDVPVHDLSGTTSVDYDFGANVYTVRNGGFVWTSPAHVSFKPLDPAATIFEIPSYENRPTWDRTLNFNKFRGTLTVHYVKATDRLWVKETLPVEDYMRGLGETSNGSPLEFQKALVTAARTYALFVVSVGGKHKSEYFDLDASGNDQVYKGYASEAVRPNVVRAVEETRGTVVTYGGEMVVTPYFSNSDGRTRSWSEVWGGSHPWLVSKPAPHDAGMKLWGHGVGMSANDAVGRANDGEGWQDILKYYYTGIDLRQLY